MSVGSGGRASYPPGGDVALGILSVRFHAASLPALHEFALQCDESDRHGSALSTRIGDAPHLRSALCRCDRKPILRVLARKREGDPAMMGIGSLNYLPIFVAAIASFVFG